MNSKPNDTISDRKHAVMAEYLSLTAPGAWDRHFAARTAALAAGSPVLIVSDYAEYWRTEVVNFMASELADSGVWRIRLRPEIWSSKGFLEWVDARIAELESSMAKIRASNEALLAARNEAEERRAATAIPKPEPPSKFDPKFKPPVAPTGIVYVATGVDAPVGTLVTAKKLPDGDKGEWPTRPTLHDLMRTFLLRYLDEGRYPGGVALADDLSKGYVVCCSGSCLDIWDGTPPGRHICSSAAERRGGMVRMWVSSGVWASGEMAEWVGVCRAAAATRQELASREARKADQEVTAANLAAQGDVPMGPRPDPAA